MGPEHKALYTTKSKLKKDKMNQNVFAAGFLAVSALFVVSVLSTFPVTTPVLSGGVLAYTSDVCVEVTRADGTHYTVECIENPNFFSNAGRNAVMDLVGGGALANLALFRQIALCNGTNSVGGVQCYIDSGLTNATGTFLKVSDPGNWSISNTFTSTADNKAVNSTALFNGSTTGSTYFAGNNFTVVTLNNNDQITIRWNISIS